jgi:hypothetical protein
MPNIDTPNEKRKNDIDSFRFVLNQYAKQLADGQITLQQYSDKAADAAKGRRIHDYLSDDEIQNEIAEAKTNGGNGHDAEFTEFIRRARPRTGLPVLWGKEAAQPQPLVTVVRGLLHSGSMTVVYGPPKSGKSFWLTSLFLGIAGGKLEWMGHRITKPGRVIYFACEGHAAFWKRLKAAGELPDNFGLVACRTELITVDGRNIAHPHAKDILNTLNDMAVDGMEMPVAIAIDTVFRSFGRGNVNQSDHMNAYIAALAEVLDRGIAVAAVHHATKVGTTPAGSVSLTGAADTIIATKNGASHTWEVEAAKDDAQTEPRAFTLDVTQIGTDEYGDPITSCVMTDQGFEPDTKDKKKKGRPKQDAARDLAMAITADAILDHGETRPHGLLTAASIGTVVHVDRWWELYLRKTGAGEKRDSVRKRFNRIKNDLLDQGRIGMDGDWVWIAQ